MSDCQINKNVKVQNLLIYFFTRRQVACAFFAFQRFRMGADAAFAPAYEVEGAGSPGAFPAYPGAPDPQPAYSDPPFSQPHSGNAHTHTHTQIHAHTASAYRSPLLVQGIPKLAPNIPVLRNTHPTFAYDLAYLRRSNTHIKF